jgi:hypothetical protein
MLKTQSTIFPCPPVPESVAVSPTKAYWVRFTDAQGMIIVRLQRDPAKCQDSEGSTYLEYEELEVKLLKDGVETLAKNFDQVWLENAPAGEPVLNPVAR